MARTKRKMIAIVVAVGVAVGVAFAVPLLSLSGPGDSAEPTSGRFNRLMIGKQGPAQDLLMGTEGQGAPRRSSPSAALHAGEAGRASLSRGDSREVMVKLRSMPEGAPSAPHDMPAPRSMRRMGPLASSTTVYGPGVVAGDGSTVREVRELDARTGARDTEQYQDHGVRLWEMAASDRLSTFAIDVDTASYTIARRTLREGAVPQPASVRVEEFVNYFRYDDPPPAQGPIAVALEASPSPFAEGLTVLRVSLRTAAPSRDNRKPLHLTFLVDTSGSMQRPDKIELVKRSLRYLVDQLGPQDTVALATYAGSVRKLLDPTGMEERARIHAAIEGLTAGGSTAMASGLELAYQLANRNFMQGSVNRVIVCSDGDANVGKTSHGDMLASIAHYAARGVTLSTIGFGTGNYQDHKMEQLADKGNGNYYYVDDFRQAQRIFGEQLMGTMQVVAKDVKVQVDFDPAAVERYRLVGYENRHVADRDFRNDKVDAGEIGLGHSVTAIYEVKVTEPQLAWATARVRYKAPDGDKAVERAFPIRAHMQRHGLMATTRGFRRALAAACLAENLRQSPFTDTWTMAKAEWLARKALDRESEEELELIELIERAAQLMGDASRSLARR